MAETKTARPKKKAAGGKAAGRASSSVKKAGSKSSKSSKARSSASSRAKAKRPAAQSHSTNGVSGGAKAVRETIGDAGQKAGRVTGEAASKAKIPLIAGGAAVVGAASGLALAASRSHGKKVLGMRLPRTKVKIRSKDLVKGADKVARAGEQIGRLSTGLREIQGTSGSSNGHDRSPIEVVLQGLTRRR